MAAPTETFRFLDLPVELRNKVYCELLCSFTFEEEPTGRPFSTLDRIMDQGMFSINEARTTSDTSILLVSRAIHREAYDIMVKSNQFIRIRGRDFNWSEILPQSKLPVVTMDRQRVAQFRGYVLCMTVEEDILDSEDEDRPPAVFDFMILGRHWKLLCQVVSYLHSQLDGTRFQLVFDPACLTEQSGYKYPVDTSFMKKTELVLLEPPQSYWRGIETFMVEGLIDANLGISVKSQVATKPWSDHLAWLSRLEENCLLVEKIRNQGKIFEAFAMWENISSESQWIPHWQVTADPDLSKKYTCIFTICALGQVRCYLHVLRNPPPHTSEQWFKDMVSHAYFTVQSFLNDSRPNIRAQFLLFKAQLQILVEVRSDKSMDLLSAQRIASTLLQAEELDPDNEEVKEEEQSFLEASGLKRLTIREIATAL